MTGIFGLMLGFMSVSITTTWCASVDANYTVGVDPNAYTDPKESSIPLNVADKVDNAMKTAAGDAVKNKPTSINVDSQKEDLTPERMRRDIASANVAKQVSKALAQAKCKVGYELKTVNGAVTCVSRCNLGYCLNGATCIHPNGTNAYCKCPLADSFYFAESDVRCETRISRLTPTEILGVVLGSISALLVFISIVIGCCWLNSYIRNKRLKRLGRWKGHDYPEYANHGFRPRTRPGVRFQPYLVGWQPSHIYQSMYYPQWLSDEDYPPPPSDRIQPLTQTKRSQWDWGTINNGNRTRMYVPDKADSISQIYGMTRYNQNGRLKEFEEYW